LPNDERVVRAIQSKAAQLREALRDDLNKTMLDVMRRVQAKLSGAEPVSYQSSLHLKPPCLIQKQATIWRRCLRNRKVSFSHKNPDVLL